MTGGAVSIQYTSWHFNEPPVPTEYQFNQYKRILLLSPSDSLSPDTDEEFNKDIKWHKYCIIGGVIGIVLCVFGETLERNSIFYDLVEGVGGILFIIGFFSFFGLIRTSQSYSKFCESKNSYYSTLKNIIESVDSYEDFLMEYEMHFLSANQVKYL